MLFLIFLVFFTLTVTQASSVAQTAADAAVLRIQEHDTLSSLPADDPATPEDERKEAFIALVLSDQLIQEGRAEVYRRLCPSNRWIVGDSCSDWGYNFPLHREWKDLNRDGDRDDLEGDMDGDTNDEITNCLKRDPNATAKVPPIEGDTGDGLLYRWPDVKVWIAFPNFPLPGRSEEDAHDDGIFDLICDSNPLRDIEPGDERWRQMVDYPLEAWRIVVTVDIRPIIPGLMNFFIEDEDINLQRKAISCGPLFLSGPPDLWKC